MRYHVESFSSSKTVAHRRARASATSGAVLTIKEIDTNQLHANCQARKREGHSFNPIQTKPGGGTHFWFCSGAAHNVTMMTGLVSKMRNDHIHICLNFPTVANGHTFPWLFLASLQASPKCQQTTASTTACRVNPGNFDCCSRESRTISRK
jgi:hypothetical protein